MVAVVPAFTICTVASPALKPAFLSPPVMSVHVTPPSTVTKTCESSTA